MDIKQMLIGLSATAIIMLSLFAPMLLLQPVMAQDPSEWYMTVSGVLDSDYYTLYPFENKSLTIGLSKFGELIDAVTKKGLEYEGVDPFASDPYVPEFEWSQGWVINITYAYGGWYRNVWAFALYSDSWGTGSIGGNWKRAPAADSTTVIGGRKYGGWSADGEVIGYVETDPLQVLYNGPRLFVALSRTTIYEDTAKQNPLVRLDLTFVFEKVKKYVIVFKDIKRLDNRKFSSDFQVEFSNRGEWDLGKVQTPRSYVHFFNDQPTCYHEGWHPYYPNNAYYDVVQIISYDTPGYVGFAAFWPSLISKYVEATTYITRRTMLTTLETYIAKFSGDGQRTVFQITAPHPAPIEYPRGDGVWSDEPMVFVNGKLQASLEKMPPEMPVEYPYIWFNQNDTVKFVNPPPSGKDNVWFVYKKHVHKVDMSVEPAVPYVIGEWDFDLPNKPNTQFRAVTVYGIVNKHDATDSPPKLDREVKYLLDEIFNPWDLNDAVHKDTSRYVKFVPGPLSSGAVIPLGEPLVTETWDAYCSFAERVILLPDRKLWKRETDYVLLDKDGNGAFDSIKLKTSVASGKTLKILYSTSNYWKRAEKLIFEFSAENSTELSDSDYKGWTDPLGVTHEVEVDNIQVRVVDYNNTVDFEESFEWALYGWEVDFKVFKESTYTCSWDYYEPMLKEGEYANVSLDLLDIHWSITAPETDVHIWELGFRATIDVAVSYNATTGIMNITAVVTLAPPVDYAPIDVLYSETIPGRYEWTIVGRDAHTVDSAGAALVTAAFKNKQVEIGLAGADMLDADVRMQMPYVMNKFGTGTTMADYKDAKGRAALRDDWCTTWPVASSNLIAVGGPIANLLAYYANDFTPALWGIGEYAASAWADKIIALSCWSKKTYASSEKTGYAVVATYKDLNGTVLFLIWGDWGRDTYYATKWFHEKGIYELQGYPDCVTAIILKIDYTKHEPAVSVVEKLGTISELILHPDP